MRTSSCSKNLEHKKAIKAIKTKKELHWSNYRRLSNKVTAKMRREKAVITLPSYLLINVLEANIKYNFAR